MIRNYLFSALLVLLYAMPSVLSANQGMELVAPSVSIAPDQTGVAEISLKQAPGLAAMEWDLQYDPEVLELVDARSGALAKGMTVDIGKDLPGYVIINMAGTGVGPSGEGVLLEVEFRAKADVGQKSVLDFENVIAWQSSDRSEIPVQIKPGEVRVEHNLPWKWIIAGIGGVVLLLLVSKLRRGKRS